MYKTKTTKKDIEREPKRKTNKNQLEKRMQLKTADASWFAKKDYIT